MNELREVNNVILFKGKARDLDLKAIIKAYLKATRPVELLEAVDFSKN